MQFITCVHSEWKECSSYSPPATVILLLFLGFEALLFAIFTSIMLGTQMNAIWNDETVSKNFYFNNPFLQAFIRPFVYLCRVSNNWRKKRLGGSESHDGSLSIPYLAYSVLHGFPLSPSLRWMARDAVHICTPSDTYCLFTITCSLLLCLLNLCY